MLDWSAARWAPGVCVDCGEPANLRDPLTGASRHKPCAERAATPERFPIDADAPEAGAALGPERAAKRRETVKYRPEGYPFSVARFRDALAVWPPEPVRISQPALAGGADEAPAVESPPVEHVIPMRDLQDGDPCPKGVHTVHAALVKAGWTVRAVYACVRRDGVPVHSVSLRARQAGTGRRCWAVWVDGKATGGQVSWRSGTLGITEWRKATGSAPAPRKAPQEHPPVDLRPMDTPAQGALL